MKTKLVTFAALAASIVIASAAEKAKPPHGGRVIDKTDPHTEFAVNADKKIEIWFLDKDGKVVAPAAQVVTVVMGDRANPTKLSFAKEGEHLVSAKAIPDGKELPVVLQIRAKEGDAAVTEKFNLNLAVCPECKLAEYACICDHHE